MSSSFSLRHFPFIVFATLMMGCSSVWADNSPESIVKDFSTLKAKSHSLRVEPNFRVDYEQLKTGVNGTIDFVVLLISSGKFTVSEREKLRADILELNQKIEEVNHRIKMHQAKSSKHEFTEPQASFVPLFTSVVVFATLVVDGIFRAIEEVYLRGERHKRRFIQILENQKWE